MIRRSVGFMESFYRKDSTGTKATHYCPGCGHGIIHKLIAEAIVDLGVQDRTIFVSPVGCGAFCYYYFDCGHVAGPHGRASAVATGIARALKDKVIIAYQGDGDLGAIGFNNAFQAANRGEKFACFFVNNSIFGMTGGQMAPTTLPGQKTTTSPFGRDVAQSGHPLRVCEVLSQLEAPVYIERVSVADTKRIMQARKAVRKAIEIQRDGKGYAFVEFLAQCPTNWRLDALKSSDFVTEEMEKYFPLGCFRDRSAEAPASYAPVPQKSLAELFGEGESARDQEPDLSFAERSFKFAGFGGQGILSLGLVLAEAAGRAGHYVSWFPSYGPEQRGGSASCSVVLSGREIGSPSVDRPDVLVALNQPALERFLPAVHPGGVVVYESAIQMELNPPAGVRVFPVPALRLAVENEVPKAANTAMLGAMTALKLHPLGEEEILAVLRDSFHGKANLVEKNRVIFRKALEWVQQNPC